MNHPPFHRLLRTTRIPLLGVFLLAQALPLRPVHAASPNEICQQVGTCSNIGVSTIFWAPCGSGSLSLTLRNPEQVNKTLAVYSRDVTRRLSVDGTSANDILVGSPGTSETLRGGGGRNTYVVGGSNTYLLGNGDRVFTAATSGETDGARLTSALPDYIHINTNAQSHPGSLLTAASPTAEVPLRGSGELNPPPTCPVSLQQPFSLPVMERAQVAQAPTDRPCRPCLPATSKTDFLSPGSLFPGVTTLEGFDLAKGRGDRILLPAGRYRFQGESLEGKAVLPILVVDRIQVGEGRLVSPDEWDRLQEQAKGLADVPADLAPLVYFRQYGLLVFSQGNGPLGSRTNPGQVIARLLDRKGRPLTLRVSSSQIFPARFVSFVPWQGPQDDIR